MKNFFSKFRVRYAETDQMGVVHHGNYAQYLEIARIEWLEQFGIFYGDMEKDGIMLPVHELHFKFHRPAKFGDWLTIETSLREMPGARITFDYTIKNQNGEILTSAFSTLVFMETTSKKPIKCPEYIFEKLKE